MSKIEVSHLMDMGVACLAAFFIVISLGSIYIYMRVRAQAQSTGPAPAPPTMTVDHHATDGTSGLPSVDVHPPEPTPPEPTRPAPARKATPPVPAPIEASALDVTAPLTPPSPPRKTLTPIDEVDGPPTEVNLRRPKPAGLEAEPEDATERVNISGNRPRPEFIAPPAVEDFDAETATVIIDRSKPIAEDE